MAALFGFACLTTFASWFVSRRYGGSVVGSLKRSGKFVLFVFLCAQYLVQVGKAMKSASGAAPAFRKLLHWLEALQFSGLSAPAECLTAPPFSAERMQMALLLGTLCCLFILAPIWMGLNALSRHLELSVVMFQRGISCFPNTRGRDVVQDIAVPRWRLMLISGLVAIKNPALYRSLISKLIAVLFALVCNTCLGVMKCDIQAMTVSAYSALRNDGSTFRRMGLYCGIDGCLSIGTSIISPKLTFRQIDVSVVSKHSSFVCGEAEHQQVYTLASVTIIAMTALYPLIIVTFLSARLRHMVQRFKSQEPVKMLLLRPPCAQLKGSWCARYSVGRCSQTSREPTRTPLVRVRDDEHTFGNESIFSREATSVGNSIVKKSFIVDSEDFIREADNDSYFAPLAGSELLPSGFYFMQLGQMTAVILSVSLTYLDGYERAWWRFALNSVTILGFLGLLFTTKPYRESFSMHVQTSLLVVSYMVTLTGFIGTLSSPPRAGIRPSNLNSTLSRQTLTASLPLSMNVTSWFSLTEATHAQPSLRKFTVVLSYLTLVVMGAVATFLVISFFGALKAGADQERKLNTRSLALKVGARVVSASRAVIYSLSSILRNQKPRGVEKEAKPPHLALGLASMHGKPLLPNESRVTMQKSPPHIAGITGTMNKVLRRGDAGGEMLFSPFQPREPAIFPQSPETLPQGLPSNAEPRASSAPIQTGRAAAAGIVLGVYNPLWQTSSSRRVSVHFSAAKKSNRNN
jgi:hypothetical protein